MPRPWMKVEAGVREWPADRETHGNGGEKLLLLVYFYPIHFWHQSTP